MRSRHSPGIRTWHPGGRCSRPCPALGLPESFAREVAEHLEVLDTDTRGVVEVAAVIGDPENPVAAALGIGPLELERAVDTGLLVRDQGTLRSRRPHP